MKSDLDIARSAKPMAIIEVADKLGLSANQLTMYGENIAKIKWEQYPILGSREGKVWVD